MAKTVTKTEKLLRQLKKTKNGMTRKEMVTFLLSLSHNAYSASLNDNRNYNSTLYGTSARTGILEKFCKKTGEGTYVLRKSAKIEGPFTEAR